MRALGKNIYYQASKHPLFLSVTGFFSWFLILLLCFLIFQGLNKTSILKDLMYLVLEFFLVPILAPDSKRLPRQSIAWECWPWNELGEMIRWVWKEDKYLPIGGLGLWMLLVTKPCLLSSPAPVCQNRLESGWISRKIVLVVFNSLCSRTNPLTTNKDTNVQESSEHPFIVSGCLVAWRNLMTSSWRE